MSLRREHGGSLHSKHTSAASVACGYLVHCPSNLTRGFSFGALGISRKNEGGVGMNGQLPAGEIVIWYFLPKHQCSL